MKHSTYRIAIIAPVLAMTAAALGACDNIGEDERYIHLPAVEAKRVVLVEEYTGQNCVNCPEAHEEMAKLAEQYPGNVVTVSIHGGGLAMSDKDFPGVGLAGTDSEAYFNEAKVAAPPAAAINRTTGVILKDQWAAAVRKEVERPSHTDIAVEATLDAGKITVLTKVNAHDKLDGNLNVWLLESGIKTLQLTSQGFKADYEHNHVLRAPITAHDGEKVQQLPNIEKEYSHAIDVKDGWNTDNLEVVVFIANTTGVEQAAKTHVVKKL